METKQERKEFLNNELEQIAKDFYHISPLMWPAFLLNKVDKIEAELKALEND